MAKPKLMCEKPIRAHVEPELAAWLNRWSRKERIPVALIVRKILRERFESKHKA